MPDPTHALETERDNIFRQMSRLGDMRKGSITEVFRCCGKPACACSAPDHPGHGPYYAFTTKVASKTKTVQLRAGPRLDKFQREVDAYKQFRALSEKLVEVNQALCEARPAPDTANPRSALKKTSQSSSRRRSGKK
jgi:hypothetical protein